MEIQHPGLQRAASALVEGHGEPFVALRRDTLAILDKAILSVMPDRLLAGVLDEQGNLRAGKETLALGRGRGLHVLVVGKGSAAFARVASERLPEARGLVIAPEAGRAGAWQWVVGEHPVPDKGSLEAGETAYEFVSGVEHDETLLVLLSGGASSLMEVPEVPLGDLALTTSALLARGATIQEMNAVRKHLSRIKGGRLAAACRGRVLTLAISDVPHDDPATLGSGPFVPDPTTYAQALTVLQRVGADNFPPVVIDRLKEGMVGQVPETPKPGTTEVRSTFHLLATNRTAVAAATARATELGYQPHVIPSPLEGEARVMGETLARRMVGENVSLIAGGEATVRLRSGRRGGPGLGGRCQELALAAALHMRDAKATACAFATDGVDGPTDAAGAIVDGRTLARGLEKKRDPKQHLEDNDTYTFFASVGDLIRSGSTGTNVMDLFVGLVAR